MLYWTDTVGNGRVSRSNPTSIEITSYMLLTYITIGEARLADVIKITKWLKTQQNSFGGYHSTQVKSCLLMEYSRSCLA